MSSFPYILIIYHIIWKTSKIPYSEKDVEDALPFSPFIFSDYYLVAFPACVSAILRRSHFSIALTRCSKVLHDAVHIGFSFIQKNGHFSQKKLHSC